MAIQARCPECDKSYNLADPMLGKTVRCKQCGQPFTVKAGRQTAGDDDEPAQRPTGIRARKGPALPPPDDAPRPLRKPQKGGSALTLWLILGGARGK